MILPVKDKPIFKGSPNSRFAEKSIKKTNQKMKNFTLCTAAVLLSIIASTAYTQVLNDEINLGVYLENIWLGNQLSGDDAHVNYTFSINSSNSEYFNYEETFTNIVSQNQFENQESTLLWETFGIDYDATLGVNMLAWQEMNGTDGVFNEGDINYYDIAATTLSEPQFTLAAPSSSCSSNHGIQDGNNSYLFYNNAHFDISLESRWRYTAGDNSNEPLMFGDITGQYKEHINNNILESSQSCDLEEMFVPFYYSDQSGGFGNEVYYSFEITEPSYVTISTDHSQTTFDTYIGLMNTFYESSLSFDEGIYAELRVPLCPGVYTLLIEGQSSDGSDNGVFKLSVEAENIEDLTINVTDATCNEANGAIEINDPIFEEFGYTLVSYEWGDGTTNSSLLNQEAGEYTLILTACDVIDGGVIEIEEAIDEEAPSITCSDFGVEITEGTEGLLSSLDLVESLLISVSDNCSENVDLFFYPDLITSEMVGTNIIDVLAVDESGNENICSFELVVDAVVSVGDFTSEPELDIYPNPATDVLNIKGLNGEHVYSIYSSIGQIVESGRLRSEEQIDVSSWVSGLYLVQIESLDGKVITRKNFLKD